ncbi:Hypothetical Protein FCC1311_025502 [Hondaea fermentalgiana]|uniref:Tyrosine-protein kinase ephrin type A/B receptor-like domain-containing protein n=1 Tax=Hondaea fermentalgiana TaxID=2315210 RepID=A0A2R5G7M5_9STRA|nr:Hypothetical Protein FCC1311_025502 [Hondaea fermentalgiana]|eukprot:GBG26329.1 Hypothetical Protein FCC1311_025502 [Hondaea fermentalgiana]
MATTAPGRLLLASAALVLLALVAQGPAWASGSRAASWTPLVTLTTEPSDRGKFNPAFACDVDDDCLLAFSRGGGDLYYKMRPNGSDWPTDNGALVFNDTTSTKQEQAQVAVYGENKGWVLAYRNKNDANLYSIRVAYITKADAFNGEMWMGAEKGIGQRVSVSEVKGKNNNRLPTIAADKNSNVVVVWQAQYSFALGDDVNIGNDKDLISVSFPIRVGGGPITASDVTMVTSVFSGIEDDIFQDRNPVLLSSSQSQRMVVAATATNGGGQADIMFGETKVDVCGWKDRVRVTNLDAKDADITIAASPHDDYWLAAWEHRAVGIRFARIAPNEQGNLKVDSLGFIAPLGFPNTQGDEQVVLVADPNKPQHWAVFYRFRVSEERIFHLVFRVSTDDGESWSRAYYLTDEPSDNYHRFIPVATLGGEFLFVSNGVDNVTFAKTSSDELYAIENFTENQTVPDLDFRENDSDAACFIVELPRNGSHLQLGEYIRGLAPKVIRCLQIVVPDAPSDTVIHMNLEVLFDLDLVAEYLELCPFNYVGIREEARLTSGDFGLAQIGSMPRRACAARRYDNVNVEAASVFILAASDDRGLPGENRAALPLSIEAWASPTREDVPDQGDQVIEFEHRTAGSYLELRAHLEDSTFVHGEIVVTTAYMEIASELVIRRGVNISLVAQDGLSVYIQGDDILHVKPGAVLWRLQGIEFSRNKLDIEIPGSNITNSNVTIPPRDGGLMLVQGRVGKIESCVFSKSKAYGSLGQRVGGAILLDGQVDAIVNTTFDQMHATEGGAISISTQGIIALIYGCTFSGNRQRDMKTGMAGAIAVSGHIGTIQASVFEENRSNGVGGAIAVDLTGSINRILETDFIGNYAGLYGGALHFGISSHFPTLWRGGTLRGNTASGGAAVFAKGVLAPLVDDETCTAGEACMQDLSVSSNEGTIGGALYFEENPQLAAFALSDIAFSSNLATQGTGAALVVAGATVLKLSASTFELNSVTEHGGAMSLESGAEADLTDVTFVNNTADLQGGALYVGAGGYLSASACEFTDNAAFLTCREYPVCQLKEVEGDRQPCESRDGWIAFLNETEVAPNAMGCTKGVGGSVYLAAGVTAHIHQSKFSGANPIPNVDLDASYSDSSGEELFLKNQAGRHVYSESRFRLSESEFDGDAGSFAPSTSVMGCPGTCASTGTCTAEGQPSPSVKLGPDGLAVVSWTWTFGEDSAQSDAMSSASIICEEGMEQVPTLEDGMLTCERCARGSYVEDSMKGCIACPNELQTTLDVATSISDCVAPVGFYQVQVDSDEDGGASEVQVIPCTEGFQCGDQGQTLESLELAPGFWRPSIYAETVLECPQKEYCIGGGGTGKKNVSSDSRSRVLSSWPEPIYCREGHTGPYCAVCKDGYSKHGTETCKECNEATLTRERGIFAGVTIIVLLLWPCFIAANFYEALSTRDDTQRRRRCRPCGSLKASLRRVRDTVREARGPITITIGLIQVTTGFQRVFGPTYDWWGEWSMLPTSMSLVTLDASVLPTSLVGDVTFVCDSFEDGSRAMRFDLSTKCEDLGWVHTYAIAMALLYVIGPIVLFVVLIHGSHKPALERAVFLHELYKDPSASDKRTAIRILRKFYEVFELLRKYLLTSVVLLVADGTLGQVAFGLYITFFYTLLQTSMRPYDKWEDNLLATVAHTQLFSVLGMLLFASIAEDSDSLGSVTLCILLIGPCLAICFGFRRICSGRRRNVRSGSAGGASDASSSSGPQSDAGLGEVSGAGQGADTPQSMVLQAKGDEPASWVSAGPPAQQQIADAEPVSASSLVVDCDADLSSESSMDAPPGPELGSPLSIDVVMMDEGATDHDVDENGPKHRNSLTLQ